MLIKNIFVENGTEAVDIRVADGKFEKIAANLDPNPGEEVVDCTGCLAIPPFIEPHVHLDTCLTAGDPVWNMSGTLFEGIECWAKRKEKLSKQDVKDRARRAVQMQASNGVQFVRTHVDVTDPTLIAMEGMLELKEELKGIVDIQIVAFPQEGIVKDPGCDKLMWEAMEAGADIVGGMPANENSPDDSRAHVKLCFDIAEKYGAEIDMHVDETDDPFYRTLEMIADEAIARGFAPGTVTAGHTCALAAYDDHYAGYVIEKVKRAGINVITNPVTNLMLQGRLDKQPIRRGITRVKELLAAGVNVSFGQDCVKDTFYPYGSADMLQVANVVAHAAQMSLPGEIEKLYDMVTGDANKILKITGYGLEPGCRANLLIIDARDARDAIRLCPPRRTVIRDGRVLAETTVDTRLNLG